MAVILHTIEQDKDLKHKAKETTNWLHLHPIQVYSHFVSCVPEIVSIQMCSWMQVGTGVSVVFIKDSRIIRVSSTGKRQDT